MLQSYRIILAVDIRFDRSHTARPRSSLRTPRCHPRACKSLQLRFEVSSIPISHPMIRLSRFVLTGATTCKTPFNSFLDRPS